MDPSERKGRITRLIKEVRRLNEQGGAPVEASLVSGFGIEWGLSDRAVRSYIQQCLSAGVLLRQTERKSGKTILWHKDFAPVLKSQPTTLDRFLEAGQPPTSLSLNTKPINRTEASEAARIRDNPIRAGNGNSCRPPQAEEVAAARACATGDPSGHDLHKDALMKAGTGSEPSIGQRDSPTEANAPSGPVVSAEGTDARVVADHDAGIEDLDGAKAGAGREDFGHGVCKTVVDNTRSWRERRVEDL